MKLYLNLPYNLYISKSIYSISINKYLNFQKADVGLANLGITPSRKEAIDFSVSIAHDSTKLLAFSSAQLESVDWMTFATALPWYLVLKIIF